VRRGMATWIITFLVAAGATAAVSLPATETERPARAVRPDAAAAGAAATGPDAAPSSAAVPVAERQQQVAAPEPAALPAAPTPLPADRLQAVVDDFIATHAGIGSVSVGVALAEPGVEPWFGGDAAAAAEPYGILSITKTFTEALVLREAAAGRIDLDAPMPTLPGVVPVPAGVVITPRMLLQHTSGVVNYMSAVGYDPKATVTPAQLVSLSLKSPLLAPPGTTASYSNTNFHWLGLLLEHTTGRTFADLVAGLALEVGLPNTALDPAGRPGWIGYASGGIRSTVADVTRWGMALFTVDKVLRAADVQKLTTLGPKGVSHGLWPIAGGVGQIVAHGGIVYYPAERLVVVVRIDPGTPQTNAHTADLATALRAAAHTAAADAGLSGSAAG